jgi:hypothetical protein
MTMGGTGKRPGFMRERGCILRNEKPTAYHIGLWKLLGTFGVEEMRQRRSLSKEGERANDLFMREREGEGSTWQEINATNNRGSDK